MDIYFAHTVLNTERRAMKNTPIYMSPHQFQITNMCVVLNNETTHKHMHLNVGQLNTCSVFGIKRLFLVLSTG
jgi:hypothetical protein